MSTSFNKNGNINSKSIYNTPTIYDMKLRTLSDGSVWARIYWLDVTNTKTYFKDKDEAMYCINQSNRYSRMNIVDNFKSIDSYYEFMLTYPSESSAYNRWKQTSSPNANTVTGLIKITTAWDNYNYGIRYHNTSNCVYDCDTGDQWYAPIGQMIAWVASAQQDIPAADGTSQTSTELWVRIDNVKYNKFKIYSNNIDCSNIIEY